MVGQVVVEEGDVAQTLGAHEHRCSGERPRLAILRCYCNGWEYLQRNYCKPPFSRSTALEVLDFDMYVISSEVVVATDAAAVLADGAQAPRLHSMSTAFSGYTVWCSLSSLQRLARAPAPLRHLVVGEGITLSAADVDALAALRDPCSLELHGPSLAGSSDEAAIRLLATDSEGATARIAIASDRKYLVPDWDQ